MPSENTIYYGMNSVYEYGLLLQPIFVCLIQAYIFVKSLQILRLKNLNQKLSPTLILFFIYLCVLSVLQIIYKLYTIIFWRPNDILYNQQMLYGLGIVPWILLTSNPIFEICFCFERCYAVCFPGGYNERLRRNVCIFCILIFFAYIASNILINDLTNPQWDIAKECQHFSCIIYSIGDTHIFLFKIVLSATNLLLAFLLLLLIKLKLTNANIQGKRSNRVIIFIIFMTVTFEFSPDLLDFIFKQITSKPLISYIGPYRTTVSTVNHLLSILMYKKLLKKISSFISIQVTVVKMKKIKRTQITELQ